MVCVAGACGVPEVAVMIASAVLYLVAVVVG
jgi:hypothetical protein